MSYMYKLCGGGRGEGEGGGGGRWLITKDTAVNPLLLSGSLTDGLFPAFFILQFEGENMRGWGGV